MRKDRILPVDAIARGHPGCVLGIEGAEPGFLQMTPWYSSSPWREAVLDGRARGSQAARGSDVRCAGPSCHDRSRPDSRLALSSPPSRSRTPWDENRSSTRVGRGGRGGVSPRPTRRLQRAAAHRRRRPFDPPERVRELEPRLCHVTGGCTPEGSQRASIANGVLVIVDRPAATEGLDRRRCRRAMPSDPNHPTGPPRARTRGTAAGRPLPPDRAVRRPDTRARRSPRGHIRWALHPRNHWAVCPTRRVGRTGLTLHATLPSGLPADARLDNLVR